MIKKYKSIFLTAFALVCLLGLTFSVSLKYNNKNTKDKTLAVETRPSKEETKTCRPCGNNQSNQWVSGQPSNCGEAVAGVTNQEQCEEMNAGCRRCSNSQVPGGFEYRWTTKESGCSSKISGILTSDTCNATDVANLRPNDSGSGSKDKGTVEEQPTEYQVTSNLPYISEFAEEEIKLDPPSRATNTTTGACEDYVVTWTGDDDVGSVCVPSWCKYRHYSAKTNCTDNQGQEFAAFCVDPANNGPKSSSNYVIDKYIDPNDGDFSKGVVYIYKAFLGTDRSLTYQCAAENAIRYLEYDSSVGGGITTRTSGPYSRDAQAYLNAVRSQAPLTGGSCATQAWAWYQAAKTAPLAEVSKDYNVANIEIVPDNDFYQDDSGNVRGHLLVQTPSGEPISGTLTINNPNGVNAYQDGDGRIYIPEGSTLGCGDNQLSVAVTNASSDSDVKSVLLVVSKKEANNKQRFILFQTGGGVSAGATFEFDGVKNCSTCQTNVDFQCRKEGSYNNPIVLKEGTVDGQGETDWAACVYNNNDEKGNTFNAFKNDYCVVSCTEEWDFRLPGNIQTVSGRNFSFSAQIGAKRTCRAVGDNSGGGVITPINYRRADGQNGQPSASNRTSYAKDHDYWVNIMVEAYNDYLKNYSAYRGLQNYVDTHLGSRTTKSDDLNNSCGQPEHLGDWEIPASTNLFFTSFSLDLTKSPFPYTQKYTYIPGSQRINIVTATDTQISIASNMTSGSKSEDYIWQTTCPETMPSGIVRDVPCEKTCTKTRTKYYPEPGNEKYEKKIQEFLNNAQAAYNKYTEALAQIKKIYEMYKECTDWENEYTFDPEIRFTYQEESYMDKLLQHQNKNYLINRTELEKSRKSNLNLYDIEIAVGTPGSNLDFLNSTGANGGGANESWGRPLDSLSCTGGVGRTGGADPYGAHRGIDLAAGEGTAIKAAKSGVVVEAGWHYSYGNHVKIDHGGGVTSLYAHMSSIGVSVGQSVSQGQVIGAVGHTGDAYGNHLHFEVYNGSERQDPAQLLGISCPNGGGAQDGIGLTSGNPDYGDFTTHGDHYPYIADGGFGGKGTIDYNVVVQATYGVSEVEYKAEETEYRSGVYFYTINPTGEVKTNEEVDKNASNVNPLGYVYPVSLTTPQGDYPYYLNFGYVGMYNDSNRLGRIMGAAESSVLSGSAADYACVYNVCDPTMQDCPPQMCDVFTDGNGITHYYDKEGNELTGDNAKEEHARQCSTRDKVCTREKDENGNDVFCDASGNCSQDPSSYLKTCSKDCAGYRLVGYGNYTGAEVESSGRLQFLPKVISLNNLFSSGNQSAKAINWQNSKAQATRNAIQEKGESVFGEVPEFEFELSPSAMASIRSYNREQENIDKGYADFNLSCKAGGIDCTSSFLDADNLASRGVTVINSIHGNIDEFKHDDKNYSWK